MTNLRIGLLLLGLVCAVPTPGHSSGGSLKRKTDGQADGYYYNAGGPAAARFVTSYAASEFDLSAIICGSRQQTLNSGVPPFGTLGIELRTSDPLAPGYADLTTVGLVAVADASTLTTCSSTGAPATTTFGGGAGIPHPGSDMKLTATQPADGNGVLDFCGLLLDTNSTFTGDSKQQSLAPNGFRDSLGFNHFLELIVFDPALQELNLRMTGSSRFPGDRGTNVTFSRRICDLAQPTCKEDPGPGSGVTDDFITATLVIDNNTPITADLDLVLELDRTFFDPELDPKDTINLFRPIGGGPPIDNPVSFPPGRTVLRLELPLTLRQRFWNFFPINLDFEGRLQDANDPGVLASITTAKVGLSPNIGHYDDGTVEPGNYFIPRSPVQTGDAMEVRFDALDAPKIGNSFVIKGLEIVGGEIGSSGLAGLPLVTLRTEDPVVGGAPDLSPEGLLRQAGPIQFGPPATTVFLDITDVTLTPTTFSAAQSLWVTAFLNPGDTTSVATAIAGDSAASPVVGNSYVAFDNAVPRVRETMTDWMIRLLTENEPAFAPRRNPSRTEPHGPTIRAREAGVLIPLGRYGERIVDSDQ